jgi:hypothetical protein
MGGLYSEVGRDGRIDSPDVFGIRQALVSDMKHGVKGINRLLEAVA